MQTRKALTSLQEFIGLMNIAGVANKRDCSQWLKEHERLLQELFWYIRTV